MRVKNLNNTSGKCCACGSWTKHWYEYAGARGTPQRCGTKGCENEPQVGAHVKEVGTGHHRHYIAMLCRACNNRFGQELDLRGYVKLAPANIRETCSPRDEW